MPVEWGTTIATVLGSGAFTFLLTQLFGPAHEKRAERGKLWEQRSADATDREIAALGETRADVYSYLFWDQYDDEAEAHWEAAEANSARSLRLLDKLLRASVHLLDPVVEDAAVSAYLRLARFHDAGPAGAQWPALADRFESETRADLDGIKALIRDDWLRRTWRKIQARVRAAQLPAKLPAGTPAFKRVEQPATTGEKCIPHPSSAGAAERLEVEGEPHGSEEERGDEVEEDRAADREEGDREGR